jgi:hypothetical protein
MARRAHGGKPNAAFKLDVLDEPKILVGHNQTFTHPRDGLFLAGPLAAAGQPREIALGAIGTTMGLELFRQFCVKVRGFIAPRPAKRPGPGLQRQAWPGFKAAFSCEWPEEPLARVAVSQEVLENAIRTMFHHEAIYDVATLLEQSINNYLT